MNAEMHHFTTKQTPQHGGICLPLWYDNGQIHWKSAVRSAEQQSQTFFCTFTPHSQHEILINSSQVCFAQWNFKAFFPCICFYPAMSAEYLPSYDELEFALEFPKHPPTFHKKPMEIDVKRDRIILHVHRTCVCACLWGRYRMRAPLEGSLTHRLALRRRTGTPSGN